MPRRSKKRTAGEGTRWVDDRGFFCWALSEGGREGRKRIVVRAKTHAERERRIEEKLAELRSHGAAFRAPRGMSLGDYLRQWLATHVEGHRADSTCRSYRGTLETWVIPAIGRVKLAELNVLHVTQMLRQIPAEKARTAELARAVLSSALQDAVETFDGQGKQLLTANVAKYARLQRRTRPKEIASYDAKGAQALVEALKASRSRYAPLLRFLLATGLRISEALGLLVLDVAKGQVRVSRQLVWRSKAEAQRTDRPLWELGALKGRGSYRTLPMSHEAQEAVDAQLAQLAKERLAAKSGYEDNGILFAAESGRPATPRNVQRAFDGILDDLKLEHQGLHALRKTFCTHVARKAPPAVLQRLAGHTNLATTMRHYVRALDEDAAAAVEGIFDRPAPKGRKVKPS